MEVMHQIKWKSLETACSVLLVEHLVFERGLIKNHIIHSLLKSTPLWGWSRVHIVAAEKLIYNVIVGNPGPETPPSTLVLLHIPNRESLQSTIRRARSDGVYSQFCIHMHLDFKTSETDWLTVAEFVISRCKAPTVPQKQPSRWITSDIVVLLERCHTYITHAGTEAVTNMDIVIKDHCVYLSSSALLRHLRVLCGRQNLDIWR